jgi:two-component system OmpR family response regulator
VRERLGREVSVATILIIDDDPDFDEFLTIMLGLEGYSVTSAYDGETGIMAAKNQRPDLILLDIMMPDVDGYEVCRRLLREMASPPTIIFVTARASEADRNRAMQAGASDYLSKPFEFEDLVSRIKARLALPADTPELQRDP